VTTSAAGGYSGVGFGDTVSDTTTPGNIPANDTVSGVSGSSLTLAYPATGNSTGQTDTLTFTGECPIDSLNLGLSLDPTNLTVGSDPIAGNVFWSTTQAGFYCDGGGTGGTDVGMFRFDSPGSPGCWAEDDTVTSTVTSGSAGATATPPANDAFEGVVPSESVIDSDGHVPAVEFNAGRAPAVTTQPTGQYYLSGLKVTFSAAASGNETPTVQWQDSANHLSSWSNVPGANSTTFQTPGLTKSETGLEVRAVFTYSSGTATSSPATATLATAPVVTTQPRSQTYAPGESLTFTSAASGGPHPTVQWQLSTDHGWLNIAGATSTTFRTAALTSQQNHWRVRAVFTNIAGKADSNAATLTES
jgi:hypothetical protein